MQEIYSGTFRFRKGFLLDCLKQCGLLALLLAFSWASYAQDAGTVSGKVLDNNGTPLGGASVTERGTRNATTTAADGSFSLKTTGRKPSLIVTYVGYQTSEIEVEGGQTVFNISLKNATTALDSVVVVGYGTQKKTNVTSAVSSVKGEELAMAPVANITTSMAGRVTGVSMASSSGQPGRDNPLIYIRGVSTTGDNTPLIVVDGVIRNSKNTSTNIPGTQETDPNNRNVLNSIDPNTIESVTILKDAAAVAPYGLGGANGVILITTKRGSSGAPTLSVGGYYGVQKPTYVPKMLSAADYMRLKHEAYINEHFNTDPSGSGDIFTEAYIQDYLQKNTTDPDKYPITDALKTTVQDNAPIAQADLQLRGGGNNVKYFAGLGIFDQKGLFDPVTYRRYNYTVNLDVNATRTTLVSLGVNGSFQRTGDVDANSSTGNVYRAAYKFVPTAPLLYSNGLWGEFAGNSPLGVLNSGGYNNNYANTLLTTISVEQKLPFIKGLSIKGAFSFDPYTSFQKQWHTPFYYWSINTTAQPYTFTRQISSQEGGAATYTWLNENYYQNYTYTYQGYLNYHNTFGKHDITFLGVAEARNNKQLNYNARINNYQVSIDELFAGSSDKNDYNIGGGSSTGSQIGYVYRLNYAFDRRYLLEAAGRYDGHYYFAPGNRWVFFPSFSAGWVISNEKFFQSVKTIDYLKLRGSWGKSGMLAGSAFQYLSGYTLYGPSYIIGNGLVQGSFQPQERNPVITWEKANKMDVGFEATLLKSLIRVEADYFFEKRTDMLVPPQTAVPVEYGINLAQENAGEMNSAGFEVAVGVHKAYKNSFQFGVDANFSYAKNKLIQVFETSQTYNDPKRRRTGRQNGTQFGYHALGLFTTSDDKNGDGKINADDGYNVQQFGELHPGDVKYADLGGPDGKPDGKIDAWDQTVIGNPTYPRITYGLTTTAGWFGFDVSLLFQGAAMSDLNINGFNTVPFNNNNSNSTYEYYDNRWTKDNQGAKYPRATAAPYSNNNQTSDFWILSTSYLRLKTASIGYTVPGKLTSKVGMKNLRVYVTGQNVFTISNLKFADPQTGGETAYPLMKTFTFGLNASF